MNKFILMHKNKQVANISIEKDVLNKGYIHVQNILDFDKIPYGVKSSNEVELDAMMTDWNNSRCIPLGRPNYEELLEQIGIKSTTEIIPHSYMCSLTDCYWFKQVNSDKTWEDVNFRDNGFSSDLYKALFYGNSNTQINNLNSPDITTDGAIPKMWIEIDDRFYLIKSSLGETPMDVYNEIISSTIFEQLGIEHVDYFIQNLDGIITSSCECFIDSNDLEFVPVENLLLDGYYSSTLNYLEAMRGFGYQKDIDSMILGDMIIGNTDRHARNYGQIIDSETQNIVKLAPLFDHGGCDLFHDVSMTKYRPTGLTFSETLLSLDRDILQLAQKIDMESISNLVNSFPIDENRKTQILQNLSTRVENIIELSRGIEYDFDREQ